VQDVIQAFERTRFFYGDEIIRLLDNTNNGAIAFRICAVVTWIDVREIVADAAKDDLLLYFKERFDKIIDFSLRPTQNIKSETLRRLMADARKAFEFIN
jgi:hypothetical protein